jgi:hypothetical protein
MTDRDPEALLVNDHLEEMALSGELTQLHRGNRYADAGDRFEVDGVTFEVVDVTERTLGDLTDEDARREGSADLEHYRERLVRAHENFEWDDGAEVVRHRFERVD